MHAHNVKRTLHLTIEREQDERTSLFDMLQCEILPCFSSWWTWRKRFCEREAHNPHSKAVIRGKLDSDGSIIGQVSDGLAAVLAPLLDSGTVTNVTKTKQVNLDLHQTMYGLWVGAYNYHVNMHFTVFTCKNSRTTITQYIEVEKTQT